MTFLTKHLLLIEIRPQRFITTVHYCHPRPYLVFRSAFDVHSADVSADTTPQTGRKRLNPLNENRE